MFQSPASGATASTESFTPAPRREEVRHLLIGPAPAVERTIRILHIMGYAEPNDWSRPIPLGEGGSAALAALFGVQPGEVIRVLTKHLMME
ncbi:MAG: hypothetical protein HC929_08020 [Leptolyngbyaceae cyanobacterium SM2_5_2]|nr:hypothetical protein [Leptolyngbyaceae cyanobacterium SM2_5_2]